LLPICVSATVIASYAQEMLIAMEDARQQLRIGSDAVSEAAG